MHVSGLRIHPVKSTAIRAVESAQVTRAGLVGDRQWMLVDPAGELVSARERPQLFAVVADNRATGADADLLLQAAGMPDLEVEFPDTPAVTVRMFSEPPMLGRPAGEDADRWLRRATGLTDVRLVWCSDPTARRLDPAHSRPGDHTAFADGFPVNLVTDASVRQLDTWVRATAAERGEEPVPIGASRFRANIEIVGALEPFEEDHWTQIRIGDLPFRVPLPSARCVMTTIDSDLHKGKEPIRTLAKHRRWDGATWFAVNLIPDSEGTIHIGDELTIT